MDETREIDIDLRKVFYMMRTKIIFIVLITIAGAVAAGAYTHFFIAPTYTANAKFYVYSNPNTIVSDNNYMSQSEINATGGLISTYVQLLKSDTVLNKVAEELGLGSGSAIKGYISASRVGESLLFQVTVTTTDPEYSAKIANAVAKVAPDEIVRIVNAGGCNVVDYAKVPRSPSAPNTKKNILIGAAAGFIISFLAFFIYEMFDSTITNAKDLEREFDIPVLGTVPRLDAVSRPGYGENDDSGSDTANSNSKPLPKPRTSGVTLDTNQSVKEDKKNV